MQRRRSKSVPRGSRRFGRSGEEVQEGPRPKREDWPRELASAMRSTTGLPASLAVDFRLAGEPSRSKEASC